MPTIGVVKELHRKFPFRAKRYMPRKLACDACTMPHMPKGSVLSFSHSIHCTLIFFLSFSSPRKFTTFLWKEYMHFFFGLLTIWHHIKFIHNCERFLTYQYQYCHFYLYLNVKWSVCLIMRWWKLILMKFNCIKLFLGKNNSE